MPWLKHVDKHSIANVRLKSPCLQRGGISTTCDISMLMIIAISNTDLGFLKYIHYDNITMQSNERRLGHFGDIYSFPG